MGNNLTPTTPWPADETDEVPRKRSNTTGQIERRHGSSRHSSDALSSHMSMRRVLSTEDVNKEACSSGEMRFNKNPPDGIKYLIELKLLKATPEDVAVFLYTHNITLSTLPNSTENHKVKLSKVAIGEYLGSHKEFNKDVLKCFVQQHEFKEMDLVNALRVFLRSFVLPGESQQIDRIMETFAMRYCSCNPGIFNSTDTCYVLSFSIIMLNTELHNPNVQNKPSTEKFIDWNKGLDDGKDLPQELLKNYYSSIKGDPLPRPEDTDDLTEPFFSPDNQGWLLKEGTKLKIWRRRWFILDSNCLCYYISQPQDKDENPRVIIPLINIQIRDGHDPQKPYMFEIVTQMDKGSIKTFEVGGSKKAMKTVNHEVYRMRAENEIDKAEWMKKIQANIQHQSFSNLLLKRRQSMYKALAIVA